MPRDGLQPFTEFAFDAEFDDPGTRKCVSFPSSSWLAIGNLRFSLEAHFNWLPVPGLDLDVALQWDGPEIQEDLPQYLGHVSVRALNWNGQGCAKSSRLYSVHAFSSESTFTGVKNTLDLRQFMCIGASSWKDLDNNGLLTTGKKLRFRVEVSLNTNISTISLEERTPRGDDVSRLMPGHVVGSMWFNKQFTDFNIIARAGKEFGCHRTVLAAASPVFNRMICDGMQEGLQQFVNIDEPGDAIEALLEFIYLQRLPVTVDCPMLLTLIRLADYYEIPGAVTRFAALLGPAISEANVVDVVDCLRCLRNGSAECEHVYTSVRALVRDDEKLFDAFFANTGIYAMPSRQTMSVPHQAGTEDGDDNDDADDDGDGECTKEDIHLDAKAGRNQSGSGSEKAQNHKENGSTMGRYDTEQGGDVSVNRTSGLNIRDTSRSDKDPAWLTMPRRENIQCAIERNGTMDPLQCERADGEGASEKLAKPAEMEDPLVLGDGHARTRSVLLPEGASAASDGMVSLSPAPKSHKRKARRGGRKWGTSAPSGSTDHIMAPPGLLVHSEESRQRSPEGLRLSRPPCSNAAILTDPTSTAWDIRTHASWD